MAGESVGARQLPLPVPVPGHEVPWRGGDRARRRSTWKG